MKPGDLREVEIAPEFLKLIYLTQREDLRKQMSSRTTYEDERKRSEDVIKKKMIEIEE